MTIALKPGFVEEGRGEIEFQSSLHMFLLPMPSDP